MPTDLCRDRQDLHTDLCSDKTCVQTYTETDETDRFMQWQTRHATEAETDKTVRQRLARLRQSLTQAGIQTKQIIKTRLRGMRYIFNEDTQCNQDALTRYVRFTYTEVRKINVLSKYVT